MKKRILSLLMAVVMAFTCLPITALAEGKASGNPSSSGSSVSSTFGVTGSLALRIGIQTYTVSKSSGLKYDYKKPQQWSTDVLEDLNGTLKKHLIGGGNKFYYYVASNGADIEGRLKTEDVFVAQGKETTSFISVNNMDTKRIGYDVSEDAGLKAVEYINNLYLTLSEDTTFAKKYCSEGYTIAAAKKFLNAYPNLWKSFRTYINYASDLILEIDNKTANQTGRKLLNTLFTPGTVTTKNASQVGCINYISFSLLQQITGSSFPLDQLMEDMEGGKSITKIPAVCAEICTVYNDSINSDYYIVNAYQQHANQMHVSTTRYITNTEVIVPPERLTNHDGMTWTEILLDFVHGKTNKRSCCSESARDNGWKFGSWGFFRPNEGSTAYNSCAYVTPDSKIAGEHIRVYEPLSPKGWDDDDYPLVGFAYYWPVAPGETTVAEFAVDIEPIWSFDSHSGDWTTYAKTEAGKVGMDAVYAVTLNGSGAATKVEERYGTSQKFEVVTKVYTSQLYEAGGNTVNSLQKKCVPFNNVPASFNTYKSGNAYPNAGVSTEGVTRSSTSKVQMSRAELIKFLKGDTAQYFTSSLYVNTKIGWKSLLTSNCYATVKIKALNTDTKLFKDEAIQSPTKSLRVSTPIKDGGFIFEPDEVFNLPPIDEDGYWDWGALGANERAEWKTSSFVSIIDPGSFLDDSLEDDTTPVTVIIFPSATPIELDTSSAAVVGDIKAIPSNDSAVVTKLSEALTKAVSTGKPQTCLFSSKEDIIAFKSVVTDKTPFGVSAVFVKGLQPPETAWSFTINLDKIRISYAGENYDIDPDGSKDHVTKTYSGPTEPTALSASMYYNVTATPDAYELPLSDHSASRTCALCAQYIAKGLTCMHEKANPHAVSEETKVTIDLWGDDSAVTNYKRIAENATQGEIKITITQKGASYPTNGELRQTIEQGQEFANLTGLNGKTITGRSYANTNRSTYYTGVYSKTFTTDMGPAMMNLLNKKQLILRDMPFSTYLSMNQMLSGTYTVIIEMRGKYTKPTGTVTDFDITWMPSPRKSDDVSWFAPAQFRYNSELEQNYAEIKNGAILNEEFEAMAGTPSTRNLYFASGGNEFLVNATYSLATTNAQRTYKYTAKPIICKYDYVNGAKSEYNLTGEGSHPTSHACFAAAGDSFGNCNQSSKAKHAHVTGWKITTAGVHTAVDCTCACPTTVAASCADVGCTTENCSGGHTKPHCSGGCVHGKGGHCSYSAAVIEESSWSACLAGGGSWSFSSGEASCGKEGCSAVNQTRSDNCKGNETKILPAGYKTPTADYESAVEVPMKTIVHCGCHCSGGHNFEHTRHIETYSETWWTLAKDITFMQIDDLKVWKLHASRLTDTEELFGVSEIRGYNTTEDPVIYVRKLKNVGSGNGKLYQKNTYDVNHASAAGRILYNWFPDQGDTVNLVTTSTTKGTYAGSTSTIKKQLYTPDTCSQDHYSPALGHYEKSPAEVMNTFLQEKYFTNVKNDTTLTGHRFGLSVISDYILITANDSVLQSVYYHEYKAFAGYTDSPEENKGTPLYDVAKFSDTVTSPNYKVANNSDTDRTEGTSKALHSKGQTSLGIKSAHWKGIANSRSNYDILKEVGENKPDLAKAKFFWDENSYCTKGGNISNEGMYYGGYNGRCTQPSSKYDASDLRTRYKQNMTFSNLYSTIVYKYWNSKYSMQHDMNETYEQLSYNNKGPTAKPAPVTPHYKLQAQNLMPIRTSENGEYSFGTSEVFYLYLGGCEINQTDRAVYRYPVSKVRWAGANGFTRESIYTDRKAGSTNTWKGINNVIIFDPIATNGRVARDDSCQPLIDQRDPAGSYGGELTYNLEGDGLLVFSLVGDFYQSNRYGLDYMSDKLGKGYYDNMDTTEWCQYKYVTCNDYIIIDTNGDGKFTDEKVHSPGELIRVELTDNHGNPTNTYRFYLPEMAFEGNNVEMSFNAEAINEWDLYYIYNATPDNQYIDLDVNNRNYCRPHDCKNIDWMDVVGVIGNLTMTDTGDFRYSNFFKKMLDGSWLVPNVVYQVDESKQARLLIDKYDIFGRDGLSIAEGWNTYGTQTHKGSLGKDNYKAFPLMPKYNNIKAFQNTPVRIGYDVFLDVETVGNYYSDNSEVTVKYSYYAVDQTTGKLTPLDVYMTNDLKYVKINDFNNNETGIYNYPTYLKWTDECLRRQYTALEKAATENVKQRLLNMNIQPDGTRVQGTYTTAGGTQTYQGDRNTLHLDSKSRNFIGDYYYSGAGDGFNKKGYTNVGTLQDRALYQRNSQKWYFSCGLPSSAVFVEAGKPCTSANMKVIDDNNNFLLVTAYIVAKGDVWTLIHNGETAWGSLKDAYPKVTKPTPPNTPKYNKDPSDPKDPDIPSSTPPTPIVVITVPPETSRDDADTMGTH